MGPSPIADRTGKVINYTQTGVDLFHSLLAVTFKNVDEVKTFSTITGNLLNPAGLFASVVVGYAKEDSYGAMKGAVGVACTLHVVPGAYHNFDSIETKAAISRDFVKAQLTALDQALA